MIGVYLRISTIGQNIAGQRREVLRWLKGNGIDPANVRWYIDKSTGDNLQRPDFERFAAEAALPRLREFDPAAGIVTEVMADVVALRPETDGAAEALVRSLSGINQTAVVSFGTEGGLFQQAGFSTAVFGPGSIDQAHQPDEFIDLRQIEACEAFLFKLRDWAVGV